MTIAFPDTTVNNNVAFFLDFVGLLPRDRSTVYRADILKFRDKTDNTTISIANTGAGFLQVTNDEFYTGNGGYLSTTFDSDLILGTNPYTIEMIVTLPSFRTAATAELLSVNVAADATSWEFGIDNLNRLTFQNGTNTTQVTPSAITVGQSVHIAVVRTSTATDDTRMYINGTLSRTFTDAVNYSYAQGLLIGAGRGALLPASQVYIKAVRITNGAAQYSGSSFVAPTSLSYIAIGDTYTYLDKIYKWDGTKWFDRSKYNANIANEYGNYKNVVVSSNTTTLDLRSANFFDIDLALTNEVGVETNIVFENESLSQTFAVSLNQANVSGTRGWSLSNASYAAAVNLLVTGQDTGPEAIFFKPDGTRMYIIGATNDRVYQYDLSTPWLVSSAVYNNVSFLLSGQDVFPTSLFFKPDGTKMYIFGITNDRVYEYDLSTAWLVSSAVYNNVSFLVTSQDTDPVAVSFKSDGTKMYMVGRTNDRVYEYRLLTPWYVASAVYENVSLLVQDTFPRSIFFKPDGTKMYMVGTTRDTVFEYDLTTPWLVASGVYNNVSFSVSAQDGIPSSLFFKPDGAKMYIVGLTNGRVYEYATTTTGTSVINNTVQWPSNISWSTTTAPSITNTLLVEFYKYNNSWHGNVIAENF